MLKKLIAGAAGAGLVLTMAGSAFAWTSITTNNIGATVVTKGVNVANTGAVAVMGGTYQNYSGNASAAVNIQNSVNGTAINPCTLWGGGVVTTNNIGATVVTKGVNVANTGAVAGIGSTFQHSSGNASASFVVVNAVNQTVVDFSL